MSWGPGWSRVATTTFRFNDPVTNVVAKLFHGVYPRDSGDWSSVCGIGFHTGELVREGTAATCLWCIAGTRWLP